MSVAVKSLEWFWMVGVLPVSLFAQTSLVLSKPQIKPAETASFELSLYSPPEVSPAAIQWTFTYAPAEIKSITVDDGPVLESTAKTILCAGTASAYKCLVVGADAKTIGNGVIAKVTAVLNSEAATAPLVVRDAAGVAPNGKQISISVKSEGSKTASPAGHSNQ